VTALSYAGRIRALAFLIMLFGLVAAIQGAAHSTAAEREFAVSQSRLADGSGMRTTAEFSDTFTTGGRAVSRQVCAIYAFDVDGTPYTFKAPRACGINAPTGIYGLDVTIVYLKSDPSDATLVRTERTERNAANNRALGWCGLVGLLLGGGLLAWSILKARRDEAS
jgi:hypothetical protein